MNGLKKTLGAFAACALLGATAAQAEGFKPGSDCNPSGFTTCVAVHLSVLKDGLSIGEKHGSWQDIANEGRDRTFKFTPEGDGWGPGHPGSNGAVTGPCPDPTRNPGDCGPPVTVTPEPVTMTLLATGLAGMSGMGFLRRKRKQPVE